MKIKVLSVLAVCLIFKFCKNTKKNGTYAIEANKNLNWIVCNSISNYLLLLFKWGKVVYLQKNTSHKLTLNFGNRLVAVKNRWNALLIRLLEETLRNQNEIFRKTEINLVAGQNRYNPLWQRIWCPPQPQLRNQWVFSEIQMWKSINSLQNTYRPSKVR